MSFDGGGLSTLAIADDKGAVVCSPRRRFAQIGSLRPVPAGSTHLDRRLRGGTEGFRDTRTGFASARGVRSHCLSRRRKPA